MKSHQAGRARWLEVLPVYGLRYRVWWLLACSFLGAFLVLLLSYQAVESWVFRNGFLSAAQQDAVVRVLRSVRVLRLDAPFLRWQDRFRASDWLWRSKQPVPHPLKKRFKEGSKPLFFYSARQPLQVLLIGDSLADSVRLSLEPLLRDLPSIRLRSRGIVSSTLTNGHFADWPQTLASLLEQRRYDLVLVFIGANSCQAVRNRDGSVVPYGSRAWPQAYGQKVRYFIQLIRRQRAGVWWLINPPMQKRDYQLCMRMIGDVQRKIAAPMADEIIETAQIVAAADGSYTQSKVVDGQLYSLRAEDGVHFTLAGSRLISREIVRRIYLRYNIRTGKPLAWRPFGQ